MRKTSGEPGEVTSTTRLTESAPNHGSRSTFNFELCL
jgi:hypothetical protein